MSLPRYSNCRDSSVEWLGSVPSHWAVSGLGYRYEVALGKMLDEKRVTGNHLAPYLRNSDVQWGKINVEELPSMDFAGEDLTRFSLKTGDLLVCEGGEIGRAAIWRDDLSECFYQKALHRLRSYDLNRDAVEYLYYSLCAAAALGALVGSGGKATIAHLPAETLRRQQFAFPTLTEQTTIAAFLDRETAKIDALVEQQRRLIELLKEKRQAVISHAVTKGLDPAAPMKDSGVEWLGDVPAHWEVVPLRWLFRFVKRQECARLDVLSVYRDFGVIDKSSRDNNNNKTPDDLSKYQTVKIGDLVINKMKAWQGSMGVSTHSGITSPDYAVFEPKHNGSGRFFNWLLRCRLLPGVYLSISNGIRNDQWRLEPDKLKEVRLPIPPVSEQEVLADAIGRKVASFDALVAEAEAAIALLLERRAALISAAVTGKIDVRAVLQPIQRNSDRARIRLIVGAAIVEAVARKPNSGRTKPHKIVYLAETHAGVHELEGSFLREAAGPLDRDMLDEMEEILQRAGHISVDQPGGRGTQVSYRFTGKRGAFRDELRDALGARETKFNRLIGDLEDLDTRHVEAVATLYAVWNDALFDGGAPTDDAIVAAFMNDWHPEKREKFRTEELHTWLGWMRRHDLVPVGIGPRTTTGRLFA